MYYTDHLPFRIHFHFMLIANTHFWNFATIFFLLERRKKPKSQLGINDMQKNWFDTSNWLFVKWFWIWAQPASYKISTSIQTAWIKIICLTANNFFVFLIQHATWKFLIEYCIFVNSKNSIPLVPQSFLRKSVFFFVQSLQRQRLNRNAVKTMQLPNKAVSFLFYERKLKIKVIKWWQKKAENQIIINEEIWKWSIKTQSIQ